MSTLVALLRNDLRLQARSYLYPATAVSTGMICALIQLLPTRPPSSKILAFLVFMDPATIGLAFVGVMILVEKSQGTLRALGVTPVRTRWYVASKATSLTLLTFAASLIVVLVGARGGFDLARLLAGLTLSSAVAVLLGIVCVTGARSLNHLVMRLLWVTTLLYLPLLAHFGVVRGVAAGLLALVPSMAMLLALEAALAPDAISPVEQAYAVCYLGLCAGILWTWAMRGFERAVLTEGR
jgi:ABC-type Na+ efflux pump permease subunit